MGGLAEVCTLSLSTSSILLFAILIHSDNLLKMLQQPMPFMAYTAAHARFYRCEFRICTRPDPLGPDPTEFTKALRYRYGTLTIMRKLKTENCQSFSFSHASISKKVTDLC